MFSWFAPATEVCADSIQVEFSRATGRALASRLASMLTVQLSTHNSKSAIAPHRTPTRRLPKGANSRQPDEAEIRMPTDN